MGYIDIIPKAIENGNQNGVHLIQHDASCGETAGKLPPNSYAITLSNP